MDKLTKFLAHLIVLLSLNQATIYRIPITQEIYYGISFIVVLYLVIFSKHSNPNWLIIWFITGAIISLIVNQPPEFFQANYRLLSFILMIVLIGPVFNSSLLSKFKTKIFYITNWILVFLVFASFIVYVLAIPLPTAHLGFSGFFNHSMMLGPLSAVALISVLTLRQKNKNQRLPQRKILLLYGSLFSSFFCLLLASSRGAIIGGIAAFLFFIFKINNLSIQKFFTSIILVGAILIISFPLWSEYTARIQEKNDLSAEVGDLAASRRSHWEGRKKEFYENPIFGIGFAVVEVNDNENQVNVATGTIEPGSSWLAALSMLGIFSCIPLFILFGKYFIKLYSDKSNLINSAALGAILIFFIVHMFAEGYFLASGSYLFFYEWLLLGNIDIYLKNKEISII